MFIIASAQAEVLRNVMRTYVYNVDMMGYIIIKKLPLLVKIPPLPPTNVPSWPRWYFL